MKITRLKKGYRIIASDAELEMLNSLVVDGFMMYEGDDAEVSNGWSPAAKAALTRALKKSDNNMQILRCVDEDRRP
jgi:hypothetical protein